MSNFVVGDEVTCFIFGRGVVELITQDNYTVFVKFESGEKQSYTQNGHFHRNSTRQVLFRGTPILALKVTQPVYAWQWLIRNTSTGEFRLTPYCETAGKTRCYVPQGWELSARFEESKKLVKETTNDK